MSFRFSEREAGMFRGPLKAVIFDWAGTTVDWGCMAPAGVFREIFAEKGIELTDEEIRIPMGKYKRDHISDICSMPRVAEMWIKVHNRPCSESDIDTLFEAFIPKQLSVLRQYNTVVPELLDIVAMIRKRGLKIGSTTGYTEEMMKIVTASAAEQGYTPDAFFCQDQVPSARPAPWMAFRNAEKFGVFPPSSIVKVGDTVADIEEGLNSGMWSVGVVLSSSVLGLSYDEVKKMPKERLDLLSEQARSVFFNAGAHAVIDTLADIPGVLDEINDRLSKGVKP